MAITATAGRQGKTVGNLLIQTYDCTCDTQYATGGDTLDLSSQFTTIDTVICTRDNGSSTYVFNYSAGTDASDGTVELNDMAASGAEVTATTDVSNITFRAIVIGLQ